MTLSKRLARLESQQGKGAGRGPSVIFICSGKDGEPGLAFFVGGGSISREPDETVEAFEARATAGTPAAIHLPENGRDALATGEAPQWAQGALAMRAQRQKHGHTD
jgi:hypothetical protein